MSINVLWKLAVRLACWLLVALGYVIAWPFWKAWRMIKRKRGGSDE